jgi:hypothetical protein
MKKATLLIIIIFIISCKKEIIIEREKNVSVTARALTNAENNAEIQKRREEMGIADYTIFLPIFPNYKPAKGQILYNHSGIAQALVINANESIATTFEGCRDSSRVFYRRLAVTSFGELALFPCEKWGELNDSADIYLYFKY